MRILETREEREELLKASKITALTEKTRLALDEPMEEAEYTGLSIQVLCSTLQTKIESLAVLSSSLEAPAEDESDDEEARTWAQLQDRSAHEYFVDLVSSRFPFADKQLAQNLGQSNWDRYIYVQKQQDIAQDEVAIVDVEKTKSEFYDSGIGSSAAAQPMPLEGHAQVARQTQSEYAATVVSSRAEASHKRMPPLPEVGRSGEPFHCEICNRVVQIRRPREWK